MSNFTIGPEHLEKVTDRASLFAFLNTALGWPVSEEDPFTYDVPVLDDVPQSAKVTRIVPFSADDPYLLILAEFKKPILRGSLRRILQGIRSDIRKRAAYNQAGLESIVFICAEPEYAGIRFAHFTEKEGRQPKLSVFGWDREHVYETRTLRDINLPCLRLVTDMFDNPDWRGSETRWSDAWMVEKVTNEFFKEFERLFHAAVAKITGVRGDAEIIFTQRVFNRLLFIRFLERKGWLSFNGRKDYLMALWEDYKKHHATGENFYTSRLQNLFFCGLNNPSSRDLLRDNPALHALIGDVPYLNGGLFEQEDDEKDPRIVVPDSALEPFLTGLLYLYNFTVTESMPDDEDVAVDPEMLGKVFESLVTGRHESGSYYTPKNVVSFMCREALKGYLGTAVSESPETIAEFVDKHNATDLRNPEAVFTALKAVRVCDPACGSGAYLLGILHELVSLRDCLFTSRCVDHETAYNRKLQIISHSIYGVDIDQFAVNLARLRLWLSLAVEGERPDPLPNLDFKVERGDSLTAPSPEGAMAQLGLREVLVRQAAEAKEEYQNAHLKEKKVTARQAIEDLIEKIGRLTHLGAGLHEGAFDWPVEFSEVFADGGFDIVLANPPYVRQEKLGKDYKEGSLKPVHPEVYAGTADLYVYFYSRAVQCLKPGGMLAFISSNKWFRAAYGAKLRQHIADKCAILSITDFGDLSVFEAIAYPMIFIAQKKNGQVRDQAPILTEPKSLDDPYPDVLAVIREQGVALPPAALNGLEWRLTDLVSINLIRKMETSGVPLGEYVHGRIYRGVLTGFNEAFVIDGATRAELIRRDAVSAEIIKPLVAGRDIKRWTVDQKDRWLIVTKIGVDMHRYPAVKSHLRQWKTELDARWDKGEHWWELRSCAYYPAFNEPKIMFPDIAPSCRFAFDRAGLFAANTAYIIPTDEFYLVGLLNSSSVEDFYAERSSQVRGGYLRFIRQYVEQIPIPNAPSSDREAISALVEKCLSAKGVACEAWEAEINERVARLYGV